MNTKKCPKCGKELPLSEFYSNKSKPDGYGSYCKECTKLIQRKTYYKLRGLHLEPDKKEEKEVKNEPVQESRNLSLCSVQELAGALKGKGVKVLVDYTPRDLILELKKMGYSGKLEYYEKKEINLTNFN